MSACDLIIGALIIFIICCVIKMIALTDRGSAFIYDEYYRPLNERFVRLKAQAYMLDTRGATDTLTYAVLKIKIALILFVISIVEALS